MHGRVKVKTSAQKEAERAEKKAKMSKQFTIAKDRIFELKQKFELVSRSRLFGVNLSDLKVKF